MRQECDVVFAAIVPWTYVAAWTEGAKNKKAIKKKPTIKDGLKI